MKQHAIYALALLPLLNGCTAKPEIIVVSAVKAQNSIAPKAPSAESVKIQDAKAAQNTQHNLWVEKCLREMQSIKVGMTRRDLGKFFTTEGGVSSASWRQYVHRECPYFKVAVEFAPSRDQDGRAREKPTNRITKISRPFLQWSISD